MLSRQHNKVEHVHKWLLPTFVIQSVVQTVPDFPALARYPGVQCPQATQGSKTYAQVAGANVSAVKNVVKSVSNTCKKCQRTYKREAGLKMHLICTHPISKSRDVSVTQPIMSSEQPFRQPKSMRDTCEMCCKTSKSEAGLRMHVIRAH